MNIKIFENHKLIAEYQNAKKFYLNDFSELVIELNNESLSSLCADVQETKTHKLNLATTDFEVVND